MLTQGRDKKYFLKLVLFECISKIGVTTADFTDL